jgi:drug/metabolite transporter (DMT)-like permease
LLFGASTPLAKLLGLNVAPQLLAGLLYLGSGIGLAILMIVRHLLMRGRAGQAVSLQIPTKELPWLARAIVAGGVLGPVFLMSGLASTDAAAASLLLNVEGVLTAVIAWMVFKENANAQIVLGMAAIVAGGMLLSSQPGTMSLSTGALLVVAACLCWAVDNNLSHKVSANDAFLVACLKGVFAGVTNTGLALALGATMPSGSTLLATLAVGFAGYGLSLALFAVALRGLGTARTGAYFSVAPLFGVLISLAIWPTGPGWTFWSATGLMAVGVWLHVRERHEHDHTHQPLEHAHRHVHDDHHRHDHEFPWDGHEPHAHPHRHTVLTHRHAHFPDVHRKHEH